MPCFAVNTKLGTAMIDSIGGPTKVNNMLSTLSLPTLSTNKLKKMERRAGEAIECVASKSTSTAAHNAFSMEIHLCWTNAPHNADCCQGCQQWHRTNILCICTSPRCQFQHSAQQATGITVNGDIMTVNGTVVDTVDINCALDCLLQWLDKYSNVIVTAHNGRRFDFPVLISALCNTNKIDRFFKCAQGLMDTLMLFRKTFPGRPSYKQEDLARDYYNKHIMHIMPKMMLQLCVKYFLTAAH
ncbi:uncharacterized protein LOC132726004 isoform X2 [Ruditapes philippinarum]|uniref:uncharacterized protein LOC132726004 isoform X2 n=1 Tax=Ruditapes philippinarum TaxID=129788 RepID=UPI00295C0112|nr:uncharacterized protein LOC132726004 isoform X2 [Ruditapes philippinarum]